MKKIILAFTLLGMTSSIYAKKDQWVMLDQDEYGWTYLNHGYIKAVETDLNIVEFGYKYVYRYGVPSLKIKPRGYIQAIHQIHCKDKTRAYIKSQRFTPMGKALDKADAMSIVYFEPMDMSLPINLKLIKTVCKL